MGVEIPIRWKGMSHFQREMVNILDILWKQIVTDWEAETGKGLARPLKCLYSAQGSRVLWNFHPVWRIQMDPICVCIYQDSPFPQRTSYTCHLKIVKAFSAQNTAFISFCRTEKLDRTEVTLSPSKWTVFPSRVGSSCIWHTRPWVTTLNKRAYVCMRPAGKAVPMPSQTWSGWRSFYKYFNYIRKDLSQNMYIWS